MNENIGNSNFSTSFGGGERILVILYGGIREFTLATGPLDAIRGYHPGAHITLLTTAPYVNWAQQMQIFNEIWVDPLADWIEFRVIWDFVKKLRSSGFTLVYDLQNSRRTRTYFRLLGKKRTKWNGMIEWCSHPYLPDPETPRHLSRMYKEQLGVAELYYVPEPDVSYLQADISHFGLEEDKKYALIVPGGNSEYPQKRWYEEGYVKLARWLAMEKKIMPVFIGHFMEQDLIKDITGSCGKIDAVNLALQTSPEEIAELAFGAEIAIGNDTGPMHLIAAAHCPSLFLLSVFSQPELMAPFGDYVYALGENDLNDLEAEDVITSTGEILLDIEEEERKFIEQIAEKEAELEKSDKL